MRILLIESDDGRRRALDGALHAAGMEVASVSAVKEIERWPRGSLVITEFKRFTPWWKEVGASHVIVLVDSAADGADACLRGASAWLPHDCSTDALVRTVRQWSAHPDQECAGPDAAPAEPETRAKRVRATP